MTVGVARQHAGITGQVENCQTVVFLAYVTAGAHALFDFRLYLPRQWCADNKRRERAQVPHDTVFATKTQLGTEMFTNAIGAGVPFGFVAGDEVYGRSSRLRAACEKGGKGYVFAVPVNFTVTLPSGRRAAVSALARLLPARCWETRSYGPGCKGHRDYDWAWAATASPRHWVLIRRSISDPSDLAFFYCHAPAGRPVSLTVLTRVAGKRWPVEAAAAGGIPAPAGAQPRGWAGTGALPSSADQAPPAEIGMVKVSVPEARRLLRLAATPMTAAARASGHSWSRWRRAPGTRPMAPLPGATPGRPGMTMIKSQTRTVVLASM